MPKVTKETASQVNLQGPVQEWSEDIDGYTVHIVKFSEDVDGTALTKGLPDDRCQCPHWGYVVSGTQTYRFADHDEVFEAGDAFYLPPGHSPMASAGSEFVMFSPTAELRLTEEAMMRNMQALQGA